MHLWNIHLYCTGIPNGYIYIVGYITAVSPFKPHCNFPTFVFHAISLTSRRKTETENYPCSSTPWMPSTSSPCSIQGPYAFSDITKLPHPAVDSSVPVDIMAKYFNTSTQDPNCDYENVSCTGRESGFVTNDIYETCRAQSSQTGWVENEIYG